MTILDVNLEELLDATLDEETIHWSCPEVPRPTALCGHDLSGERMAGDDEEVNCQACIDIVNTCSCCPICGGPA